MVSLLQEAIKKVQSGDFYEKFQQCRFKIASMVNSCSCWTYVNNQAKFNETKLTLKTNEGQFGHLW